VNFTREPIIETIITPREGFKLVVRSSKGESAEEYSVEAIEVVSFGHSFFFRCLERPKSFIVPVGDYEVIEVKETRVVLKTPVMEKSIKIGGGREGSIKAPKEVEPQAEGPKKAATAAGEPRPDKKREKRRHRRRRGGQEEGKEAQEAPKPEAVSPSESPAGEVADETKSSSSLFSKLFPPPPGLISETYAKKRAEEPPQKEAYYEQVEIEQKKEEPKTQAESPWGDSGPPQDMMRQRSDVEEPATSSSFFRLFFP